jgi:hypothetical protein
VARDTSGRFVKGARRPARAGRRRGTPNRVPRAVKDFLAEILDQADAQEALRGRILAGDSRAFFKAYEAVYGRPRQSLEVLSQDARYTWTPPARADKPIPIPPGALVFPQGAHVHEGWEEEHHCHLCHENYAARVDDKLECPRCLLHPKERTDRGNP